MSDDPATTRMTLEIEKLALSQQLEDARRENAELSKALLHAIEQREDVRMKLEAQLQSKKRDHASALKDNDRLRGLIIATAEALTEQLNH